MPSGLALWLTLNSSNYPCLEHNFMVPKLFETWKFYCISLNPAPETVPILEHKTDAHKKVETK